MARDFSRMQGSFKSATLDLDQAGEGGDDDYDNRSDDSYSVRPSHTLFRVVSAVTVIITLILVTISAAVYKLGEEKSLVLRAHASLVTEENDDLCILQRKGSNVSSCPRQTTKFYVPATIEGKWPTGFSFAIFQKSPSGMIVLYSENGKYIQDTLSADIVCETYMSELCLDGDYALFARSEVTAPDTSYVMVCDEYRVESCEALSFHTSGAKCSNEEFESPNEKLSLKDILRNTVSEAEADTVVMMAPSERTKKQRTDLSEGKKSVYDSTEPPGRASRHDSTKNWLDVFIPTHSPTPRASDLLALVASSHLPSVVKSLRGPDNHDVLPRTPTKVSTQDNGDV